MLLSRKNCPNIGNYRTFDADEKNETMWTDTPLNKRKKNSNFPTCEKLGVGWDLDRHSASK
jgi:hypothetical protein